MTQTLDIRKQRAFQKSAEEGQWRELKIGGALLLAPAQNRKFQQRLRYLEKVHCKRARKRSLDDLDKDEQDRVFYEAMFKTVVLDWRGIVDGDQEIEFNLDNFVMLMAEIWTFAVEVMTEASVLEQFEEEWRESVEKNS